MPDDPRSHNSLQEDSHLEAYSPGRLARKIESCIFRNALDEEQRAQKALYLLQARDRQIAFLEKRVAELEDVAASLHEFTLRNSSRASIPPRNNGARDSSKSEKSFETRIGEVTDEKSDCDFGNETRGNSARENSAERLHETCETSDTTAGSQISIPTLKLSKSSASNSDRDIFSTAIDFVLEKRKYFTSSTSFSNEETSANLTAREEKSKNLEDNVNYESETKIETRIHRETLSGAKRSPGLQQEKEEEKSEECREEMLRKEKRNRSAKSTGNSKERIGNRSRGKQQRSNLPRVCCSVPWIRARHSLRKKLRGFEQKTGKRMEGPAAGDGHLAFTALGAIEGSRDRRQGEGETIHAAKKPGGGNALAQEQLAGWTCCNIAGAQETRFIADRNKNETKTICTQTSTEALRLNEKSAQDGKASTNANPPCVYSARKVSSAFWNFDEEPAPQWLIEEALNRGTERSECRTKGELPSNKEIEYGTIVSELEAKLARAREDLGEALRAKSITKEKYRKSLENLRAGARKESEILQERIVRICTSVLENFGPRSMHNRGSAAYQTMSYRKMACHKRISNKLCKKLRMAMARSNKLKRQLESARKTLKSKSEENDAIGKSIDQLKREMEATETKLNNVIAENVTLRRKVVDGRNWLQNAAGKEHHAYKSRELVNLKKKVEEDSATIAQLRNKLVRSESANANKGFLLNSYKSQLTDLSKEKNQLMSKINSLENEISNIRGSNSQLKAKISVLNLEKDKLVLDNEKSRTDLTEKMETKLTKECNETLQQETEALKTKYEEAIKSMKVKLTVVKNQNIEYSRAIKDFLKKLSENQVESEFHKSSNASETSEKEAQETACHILNMTPEELTGFMNVETKNSVNPWILELNRIISANHFSKALSKFLLKKTTKRATKV